MSLIELLEAAEVGSRELDRDIHAALLPSEFFISGDPTQGYSRSLDAALALAERVLPGWAWGLTGRGERNRASVMTEGVGAWDATAPTPALALCIAILKAKETK